MEQLSFDINHQSDSRIIATSGDFQIELLQHVGEQDYPALIDISRHLAQEYGEKAVLTKSTIHKYFNKRGSLPFIARYKGEIIGYVIGVPLEELSQESWARRDENFGKQNTLYTLAFVIKAQYKANGYAKMLKRVYLNWARKRGKIRYVTGHVKLGVSSRFTGEISITNRVENWQGTGKTFEYYRRDLLPDTSLQYKHDPPLPLQF
ncbi:MAG: GNAT family N-acetyltransferase [FCB group bacterium]|nr:GNAT family N-acetyltransferase [FCB group bacterium]